MLKIVILILYSNITNVGSFGKSLLLVGLCLSMIDGVNDLVDGCVIFIGECKIQSSQYCEESDGFEEEQEVLHTSRL